jgi:hypothetical protein
VTPGRAAPRCQSSRTRATADLANGADLLPAGEFGGNVGHPQHTVWREQRREAVVAVHHYRLGELAAQRLDLEAISNRLKVSHRSLAYLCSTQRCRMRHR